MEDLTKNELFSAYLDGELTAEEQTQVERLLSENADARQLMDELRALSATLQAMPQYTLDEDIHQRVLQIAEKEMAAGQQKTDAPKAAAAEQSLAVTARHLARRFLSPRALVWSATAIALVIVVTIFNPEQPRDAVDNGPLAMSPEEAKEGEESKDDAGWVEPSFRTVPDDSTRMESEALKRSTYDDYAKKAGEGGGFSTAPGAGSSTARPGYKTGGVRGHRDLGIRSHEKPGAYGGGESLEAGGVLPQRSSMGDADRGGGGIGGGIGGGGIAKGTSSRPSKSAGKRGYTRDNLRSGQISVNGGSIALDDINDIVEQTLAKQDTKNAPTGRTNTGVAVIQCAISRQAMDAGALRKTLKANGITASGTLRGADLSARQAKNATDHGQQATVEEVAKTQLGGLEVLYVEATSRQIEATLLAMSEQPQAFYSVSIEPVPEVREQQRWANFDSRGLRRRETGSSPVPPAAVDVPARGTQVQHDLKKPSASSYSRMKVEDKLAPDLLEDGQSRTPAADTSAPDKDKAPVAARSGLETAPGTPTPRPAAVPEKPADKPVGQLTAPPTNGPGGVTTLPAAPKIAVPSEEPTLAEGAPPTERTPVDTDPTAGDEPSMKAEGIAESEPDASARRKQILAGEKSHDAEMEDKGMGGNEMEDKRMGGNEMEGKGNGRRLKGRQPRSGRYETDISEKPHAKETRQQEAVQLEDSMRPVIDRKKVDSLSLENALDARAEQGGAKLQEAPRTQPTLQPTYRVLFVVRTIDTDVPAAAVSAIRAAGEAPAEPAVDAEAAEMEAPPIKAKSQQ